MLLLASFTLQAAAVSAQSIRAQVKSIDAYCKTIDALTAKAKKPQLIFADTSDYNDAEAKPKWQSFESEKALEKFREATEAYSIAYNWQKKGKILQTNFTNFSPSGDWTMYIYHTYRDDGTLARVTSELRTFYGDYIVVQKRYFDKTGKQISKSVKYSDLTTHKPKKPSPDYDSSFTDEDVFMTTAKLPFADLLTKK